MKGETDAMKLLQEKKPLAFDNMKEDTNQITT